MATEPEQTEPMGRRRALLTDAERRRIAEDPDEPEEENYRYQAISRVRNKIEDELPEDIDILEEHHSALLQELREQVCPGEPDAVEEHQVRSLKDQLEKKQDRIDDLEAERDELQERVDELESAHREEAIDVDRLSTALDDIEAAAERGEGKQLQNALDRARDVIPDV